MPAILKVLLIDDSPEQCETLSDILTDNDCEVLPCTDPVLGEAYGSRQRFDLVLLDLKLNGVDGMQVLCQIQAQPHGCIVVLTGVAEAPTKRAALRAGANAVMEKPVDIARLLEIAHDVRQTGHCQASTSRLPVP
jgi:two-component system, NtrC family, nitrogen regulation response regulator NtrX